MNLFRTLKCGLKRLALSASDALAAIKSWFHGNFDRLINQILACLRSIWQEWVSPVARYIVDKVEKHPLVTAIVIAIAISAFLLLCPGSSIILGVGVIGFTAYGPASGSIAAWIQALIGNVSPGSLFAILQSAAMGGYGVLVVVGIQIATILASAALAFCASKYASRRKQKTE